MEKPFSGRMKSEKVKIDIVDVVHISRVTPTDGLCFDIVKEDSDLPVPDACQRLALEQACKDHPLDQA